MSDLQTHRQASGRLGPGSALPGVSHSLFLALFPRGTASCSAQLSASGCPPTPQQEGTALSFPLLGPPLVCVPDAQIELSPSGDASVRPGVRPAPSLYNGGEEGACPGATVQEPQSVLSHQCSVISARERKSVPADSLGQCSGWQRPGTRVLGCELQQGCSLVSRASRTPHRLGPVPCPACLP